MTHRVTVGVKRSAPNPTEAKRNVPAERFSDVGGADDAQEQIRQIVQGHLHPEGTGKTLIASLIASQTKRSFYL